MGGRPRKSGVQGLLQLHKELQANLGDTRCCLKKEKRKELAQEIEQLNNMFKVKGERERWIWRMPGIPCPQENTLNST